MKAHEFRTSLGRDGSLAVPPAIAEQIEPDVPLRVLLIVPETNDDEEWTEAAAREFVKGYADSDAIYD